MRKANQLRSISIESFQTHAPGSVVIACGETRVLCTASVASDPPKWLPRDEEGNYTSGWVTAEYNMMPASTVGRKRRGPDSRGTEIQRLIGRVLRAAVDLDKMPGVAITLDCDVLQADGGTRTASITGAWVALAQAIAWAQQQGLIQTGRGKSPLLGPVAAVSVGIIDGKAHLDLDYPLDSRAEVDLNVAMNHEARLIEVQGTGEEGTFSRAELNELLDLAEGGIKKLMRIQKKALKELI